MTAALASQIGAGRFVNPQYGAGIRQPEIHIKAVAVIANVGVRLRDGGDDQIASLNYVLSKPALAVSSAHAGSLRDPVREVNH